MFKASQRFILSATTAAFACLISASAVAAAWPERPINLVVGYAPGGSTDTVARLVASKLTDELSQNVVVVNKPGANGNIAANYVAKSPADGYTVLFGGTNNITSTYLYKTLPYDFNKEFTPVGMIVAMPNVLVVHPSVPANSVKELIDLAKKDPKKLNYGSSGIGSSQHLTGELFISMTGAELTHVPYKGSGPAVIDLLSGNIQVMFDNASSALPNINSGKIRALGITSPSRSPVAPSIPTIAEGGVDGFSLTLWLGTFMPSAAPEEAKTKFNAAIEKVLKDPEIVERLKAMGGEPVFGNLSAAKAFFESEDVKWAKIIKDSGATAE